MKISKLLFCFILALSLSALSIHTPKALTTSANKYTNSEYSNLSSMANNYINSSLINLSEDDYVEVFKENNQMIYLSQGDIYLMSQIVYAESKGEPFQGKVAVASVILNRVLSPDFPNTIEGVVFQPYAFSCVIDGQINVEPSQECFNAVYEAVNGNDPTGEALFFYNPDTATCNWMHDVEKYNLIPIGQHLFFTL